MFIITINCINPNESILYLWACLTQKSNKVVRSPLSFSSFKDKYTSCFFCLSYNLHHNLSFTFWFVVIIFSLSMRYGIQLLCSFYKKKKNNRLKSIFYWYRLAWGTFNYQQNVSLSSNIRIILNINQLTLQKLWKRRTPIFVALSRS